MKPDNFDLDLGDSHWLQWTVNSEDIKIGALISHINGRHLCWGHIFFHPFDNHPTWEFNENFEAPTFSPSILCRICGDHGFIKEGKWLKA